MGVRGMSGPQPSERLEEYSSMASANVLPTTAIVLIPCIPESYKLEGIRVFVSCVHEP